LGIISAGIAVSIAVIFGIGENSNGIGVRIGIEE
jgi:hypothetical protein